MFDRWLWSVSKEQELPGTRGGAGPGEGALPLSYPQSLLEGGRLSGVPSPLPVTKFSRPGPFPTPSSPPGSRPPALAPARAFRAPLLLNNRARLAARAPGHRGHGACLACGCCLLSPCRPPRAHLYQPLPAAACLPMTTEPCQAGWRYALHPKRRELCQLPRPASSSRNPQGWWQERRCPALAFRGPTLDQVRGAQFPIWDSLWGLDLDWCCLISSGTLAPPRVCD